MRIPVTRAILLLGPVALAATAACADTRLPLASVEARRSAACRDVAAVDDVGVGLRRELFFADDEEGDSAYTQTRRHFGVRKLAPSDPVVPVRDPAVCEAWLPAIEAALAARYGGDGDSDGYLFRMVRFGPYMVVVADIDRARLPPEMGEICTLVPIFVFEIEGKRLKGSSLG